LARYVKVQRSFYERIEEQKKNPVFVNDYSKLSELPIHCLVAEFGNNGNRGFAIRHFNANLLMPGGFVQTTAFADPTAFVGVNSLVLNRARAFEDVSLTNYSILCGRATIRGAVSMEDYAVVSGYITLWGRLIVKGGAVFPKVGVYGSISPLVITQHNGCKDSLIRSVDGNKLLKNLAKEVRR
jgi:hypothetical protein